MTNVTFTYPLVQQAQRDPASQTCLAELGTTSGSHGNEKGSRHFCALPPTQLILGGHQTRTWRERLSTLLLQPGTPVPRGSSGSFQPVPASLTCHPIPQGPALVSPSSGCSMALPLETSLPSMLLSSALTHGSAQQHLNTTACGNSAMPVGTGAHHTMPSSTLKRAISLHRNERLMSTYEWHGTFIP